MICEWANFGLHKRRFPRAKDNDPLELQRDLLELNLVPRLVDPDERLPRIRAERQAQRVAPDGAVEADNLAARGQEVHLGPELKHRAVLLAPIRPGVAPLLVHAQAEPVAVARVDHHDRRPAVLHHVVDEPVKFDNNFTTSSQMNPKNQSYR